jgi:glycosyltransferase involved in cell wall biosynthesis
MLSMPEVSPHLSVVIPAYNEGRRLPRTLHSVLPYIAQQSYSVEVVVVDDGSTDSTAELVEAVSIGNPNVRLVRHFDGKNHGKGATVRRGMLEARGEYRLFMDADNSTTIDHLEKFWPWFGQGYDVVIGSRDIDGADIPVPQSRLKELAGNAGNLIIRWLAVPGIYDTQAGFKMFTRRAAEEIFPRLTLERWGFDIEVLAIARRRGFGIRELPITWRNDTESKVGPGAYVQVLGEVWRIHRNLREGLYD